MPASAHAIETTILELLAERGAAKSICPSEAARALANAQWRGMMPDVRQVARRMALEGKIDITQRDRRLDPSQDWAGPVRLRQPAPPE